MIYKQKNQVPTFIKNAKSYGGEPLEYKVRRITTLKEPITDVAPLEYDNEDSDEVTPDHDIRTDKWARAEWLMKEALTDNASIQETLGKQGSPGGESNGSGENNQESN